MKQETLIPPEQSADKLRTTAQALSRRPKLVGLCHDLDQDLRVKLLEDPN